MTGITGDTPKFSFDDGTEPGYDRVGNDWGGLLLIPVGWLVRPRIESPEKVWVQFVKKADLILNF